MAATFRSGFLALLTACSMSGQPTAAFADEGTAVVLPEEPKVWTVPCSVGAGIRFTARTDRTLGTDSSQPNEPFTARVVTPVVSSCRSDYIAAGATLRGRVVRAEHGNPPVLALELTHADTSTGPQPISAAVRSGAGLEWIEVSVPKASSYREIELYPSWTFAQPQSTPQAADLQLTLPAGTLIQVELTEPVLILP
jgi:hypothetical protein